MIEMALNFISFLGIIFLVYDRTRAGLLRCKKDGTYFFVPNDEIKEQFRRAALAELSRQAGGKRVECSLSWCGNLLEITTTGETQPKESRLA